MPRAGAGEKQETRVSTDWTEGYVAEIDYTHGYYRELAPIMIRFALALRGLTPPPVSSPRYLELGFGQGLSVNIHAAANGGAFWGSDFNPGHAANARALAKASSSGADLSDASFADLLARDDLPQFDYIALHGVWTWVSDENRQIIVDIMRKRLSVGGAVYMSYNTLPGWAASMPLRHLMKLHADIAGSESQPIAERIEKAIAFAEGMVESGAAYFRASPLARERLKSIAKAPKNYLAHEYMNRDWRPMYVADVAAWLEQAKLGFGAPGNLLEHVESINLGEPARKALAAIGHPVLKESVRDYFVNQVFRRDIYVKGARRMTALEQAEVLRGMRFSLLTLPDQIPLKLTAGLGEVNLAEKIYRPLIDDLAGQNFAPKPLGETIDRLAKAGITPQQTIQALTILVGGNHAGPAQGDAEIKARTPMCSALNKHLVARARHSAEVQTLASPVLGTGIAMPTLHQFFLGAYWSGAKTPEALAKAGWAGMSGLGQRITHEGKTLEGEAEHVAHLTKLAQDFKQRLPLLAALGVA